MDNHFPAEQVHQAVLGNGLRVLLLPDATAPVGAIVTRVSVGYFDESDDVVGIAHVLEHMFFKGTARRGVGDIARETKANGGYLNAHTIYDNTTYYAVLPSSGLLAGLEIQADAYANSAVNEEELARELEVIIQEAKRKADNPSAVATETAYELLHETHRIHRWRIGREAGLRTLTRQKLLAFYRNFYKPSNTILAVAGDFDLDVLMREIERNYGSIGSGMPERLAGPSETSEPRFRFRELFGDIAQTQTVLGWRTPESLHDDTVVLDFASYLLGAGRASRLYRAIRERKLGASVTAHNYTPTELGVFTIHTEGEPGQAAGALRAAWAQVQDLGASGPSDAEMIRVRNLFQSQWVRRLESMAGKANYLADWEGLGDWRLGAQYFDRFCSVTAREVRMAVRKYLPLEHTAVLVYRPTPSKPVAATEAEMMRLLKSGTPVPLSVAPVPGSGAERPRARAAREMEEGGVQVFRIESGIPVLVHRRNGASIVYMEIEAVGGSALETMDSAGITTLAARASVKGTPRLNAEQVAAFAEEMGGSISASVGRDSVTWSLSVAQKFFSEGLALLAEVILEASIEEKTIDTEKQAAISNLALLRDDMYSYPVRLATLAAYANHPYGIPVSGTVESLSALTADTVRNWYRERLGASEWAVGILGDVDPQDAADLAAGVLRDLAQHPRLHIPDAQWPATMQTVVEMRDKAQSALALAFRGPRRNDPDRYAAAMIATVASGLGGRFFDELRDRQSLAYTVHAFTSSHPAAGMFLSYIATSPEKEESARLALLREFEKLASDNVSDEELERGKQYAIGTHAIRRESGSAVLGDMLSAWSFGLGLRELSEFEDRVSAVTPDEMQAVARRYFDPHTRVEGIIRGTGREV